MKKIYFFLILLVGSLAFAEDANSAATAKKYGSDKDLIESINKNKIDRVSKYFKIVEKPNPDAKDKRGDTALILAVKNNFTDIVKVLLANKANVDAKNADGNTALIISVKNGNFDISKALLDAKADKNITDVNGKKAIDFATSKELKDLLK